MKCLIAEDHLLSRRILKELLSPHFDCDIAVNGQEAIDSFRLAHEAKQPYDVVFMDIMMPVVDGMEALLSIRELERNLEIPHSQAVKVAPTLAAAYGSLAPLGALSTSSTLTMPVAARAGDGGLQKPCISCVLTL